jgi:hypothetical protein
MAATETQVQTALANILAVGGKLTVKASDGVIADWSDLYNKFVIRQVLVSDFTVGYIMLDRNAASRVYTGPKPLWWVT